MQFNFGKLLGKCSIHSCHHNDLNRCEMAMSIVDKGATITSAKEDEVAISDSAVKFQGLSVRQDPLIRRVCLVIPTVVE